MQSRLKPLAIDAKPELSEYFQTIKERLGFVPNSILTMQRIPELVKAVAAMSQAINGKNGKVDPVLKSCLGELASKITGCLYCQAHFVAHSKINGVESEKIKAVWNYQDSDLFSDSEKAALDFAVAASQVPNAVTDQHFDELRKYYDEEQIVEITGQLSYIAFLNRWNDTMATALEEFPTEEASEHYGDLGWTQGKHAR